MKLLKKTIENIEKPNYVKMDEAKERLGNLTKPKGSLGKLEEIVIKLAGITGNIYPNIDKKIQIIMAGDHGVAQEGVSAFPQEVTTQMVHNFLNEGAAINVLANQVGAKLKIVDMGMKDTINSKKILIEKVKSGTNNMANEAAMSRQEAIASIEAGIIIANQVIKDGANLIGTGEMGIANTTASSAILAVLSDLPIKKIVGPGTGINQKSLNKKIKVIKKAININQPNPEDGIDVLAKVGGLEIAGMTGVMLSAAANNKAVIMDGLISGAAALIAKNLNPKVVNYIFPSHKSAEPGHIKIYEKMKSSPLLDLEMRLGEGTGAVLAMPLMDSAVNIIKNMATFSEAGVSQ